MANATHNVRRAAPVDASAISELYKRIYTPVGGGDAHDNYPFPQIMNPDCVAAMMAAGDVVWLMGEAPNGVVVGAAAAVRNIGDTRDRISEVFGVVVDVEYQCGGLGSALVNALVDELSNTAEFILCEARTHEPGGWKVARNAGFRPVGYEPYAHSMPIGFESMVLTGRWPQNSERGEPDQKVPLARHLHGIRKAVIGFAPPAVHSELLVQAQEHTPILGADVDVSRADARGRLWFESPRDVFDRRAGIVGLNPLQGLDNRGARFTHAYYLARSPISDLGAAWVVLDRVDARARILGLRAVAPSVRAALLQFLVGDLLRWADNGRLGILVLVDANCLDAQAHLMSLGFFPTAFLPAFISAPQGRRDVVQYTRLAGCSLLNSVNSVTAKVWPEAETVISEVLHFACFEQACPRAANANPDLRGAA
jgi:ribosomal protein S18 acetylase RimI-like enzyme